MYAAYVLKVPMAFNCIYALDAAIEASLAPLGKGFERQHNSAVCVVPKQITKHDKVSDSISESIVWRVIHLQEELVLLTIASVRYWITAFKSGHEEQGTVDRDLPCAAAGKL